MTAVFVPPNFDERYQTAYGFTMEEIYAWGMKSVEAKWRATGYPMDEMPPDIYPLDLSLPHEERARRQIQLLKAGRARRAQRAPRVHAGDPGSSCSTSSPARPTPTRWTGR